MTTSSKKIALITGGSRGLGRATALQLARQGVGSIITYNSKKEEAEQTVAAVVALGAQAVALQLDVAKSATFAEFVLRVQEALRAAWNTDKLDILVNNAGIGISKSFAETTEEDFDLLCDIHFKGAFFLTQKLLPLMRDGGSIVNLSTGLTRFSFPGFSAYAAMKGAVEVLTHYLAKELGERRIRVNTIAPGAIETDFGGGFVRDDPDMNSHVASMTALGRVGMPEDIGGAIASLSSDDMRWVNAQRIEVSGGTLI